MDAAPLVTTSRGAVRGVARDGTAVFLGIPFAQAPADGVAAIAGEAPPMNLAAEMHAAAVAFVRDGDPGWPTWDATTRRARVFGAPASTPPVVPYAYADVAPLA